MDSRSPVRLSGQGHQTVSLLATASSVLNQLEREGVSGCLVGGLAVSAYCDPRFTLDVDLAVAVRDDAEIESVVHALSRTGLHLLVASSGIEHEIVEAAQMIEVVRGINMRVARIGHLIALKLLSVAPDRATDAADLRSLALVASDAEWERALEAVRLIEHRGFSRQRNLLEDLQALRST